MSFTESLEQLVHENKNGLLGKHKAWERVQLRSVASVLNGFAFSSPYFTKDEGKPLLRIRDILQDHTETKYGGEFDPVYVVKAGDLLIGMDGDFNCALWRGPEALLNQRVCKLTVQERFYNKKLMAYALPGYLKGINDATSSITVKHLSSRTVEEIPLPLPPRPEQNRIVAEIEKQFTRLDDAVAALKRVQANLKRYRASVLKAACEGRLVPTEAELARKEGRDYEPASELLRRILAQRRAKWETDQLQKMIAAGRPPKDGDWKKRYKLPIAPQTAELSQLPQGWAWSTADQLCTQITDGEHIQPPYQQSGHPMLTAMHVRDGSIDFRDYGLIAEKSFRSALQRCAPAAGDVLVVSVGATTGRAAIVQEGLEPFAIVRSVLMLKTIGIVDAIYLLNWIRSPWCQEWIKRASGASAQPHFYISDTKRMPVPLPPAAEARRIAEECQRRMSLLESAEASLTKELSRAAHARQSILRSAFSGKLVPHDPKDEPASVLLERIRTERARAQQEKEKTPKATNSVSRMNSQHRRHLKTLERVSSGRG